MNRFAHLDLEDLIAGATGQPEGDRAREHLAGCEQCRREADRWNLVADGVRGLAAAAQGTAAQGTAAQGTAAQGTAAQGTAQPARPGRTRRHGHWRRAMVAAGSAAAALVLLAGIGEVTGYVHVHISRPGTHTVLTAVTGCSQLQQAEGTLEQVNGGSLVIKTASGQPVTVTTTATTFVSMSGALLSDITDGATVTVRGYGSGGTIAAAVVTVGQPFSAVNPPGLIPLRGTVADAGATGFTLVTSGGTRIPVTTSGSTLVIVPHASPGQLRVGASIFAVGHAGPGGTLSARAVAAVSQLQAGRQVSVSVKDCSQGSVTEALGAIAAAPVTGR